jgi:hypothetical protein
MFAFMEYTAQNKFRRQTVMRLFINKLCPFMIHKVQEEVVSKIKNYGNNQEIIKKTWRTNRIQTVIETFERRRKNILNFNMRKWKRNQYEIMIGRNLMRRLTRNAMNWRVRDLFFTWKQET